MYCITSMDFYKPSIYNTCISMLILTHCAVGSPSVELSSKHHNSLTTLIGNVE